MKEKIGEFYRSHIRDKITTAKTVLGHRTAENIAKQLEGSQPVDFDVLLGEDSKGSKPSKFNEYGEIVDEDKTNG